MYSSESDSHSVYFMFTSPMKIQYRRLTLSIVCLTDLIYYLNIIWQDRHNCRPFDGGFELKNIDNADFRRGHSAIFCVVNNRSYRRVRFQQMVCIDWIMSNFP